MLNQAEKIEPSLNKPALAKVKSSRNFAQVKEIFFGWSQSVTYHCFPKIFKENIHISVRLIWAMVFFSFLCFTFFVLIQNIITYFEYNVTTNVQLIFERPALFPTVTICNSNPFTTKLAENVTKSVSLELHQRDITNMSYLEFNNYSVDTLASSVKSYVNVPEYGDENRKALGIDLR